MTVRLCDFHGLEMVPPAKAVVLMATMRQDRPTVRNVGAAAGLASTNTVHTHLDWLAEAGLVTWEPGRAGTLRSTLTVVASNLPLDQP